MPEKIVNITTALKYGLSKDEFEEIQKILDRLPSLVELFIYSIFWTDPNTGKSNRNTIENLSNKGIQILKESGIVIKDFIDIDINLSAIMKIESNSSLIGGESYFESAQNSINLFRNLMILHAKPVAFANSFHFSNIEIKKGKNTLKEFVNGNSSYTNTFGTPLVGLQTYFDKSNFNTTMLNSLLLGLKSKNKIPEKLIDGYSIIAVLNESPGNINSPVYEKAMLETTYQLLDENLIIESHSLSASNLLQWGKMVHSKSVIGIEIDLTTLLNSSDIHKIYDLLNSKSFASLILIGEKNNKNNIISCYKLAGLNCVEIGNITEKCNLILKSNNKTIADIPFNTIRNKVIPGDGITLKEVTEHFDGFDIQKIPVQRNLREIAWFLIKHPNIASKKWIYEQYDSMVGINNMTTNFPSSASLINLKESNSALAICIESNPLYFRVSPGLGIQIAMAEASRRITCTGAKPIAVKSSFNFLNSPGKSESNTFVGAIKGMARASKKLKTQVSFDTIKHFDFDIKKETSAADNLMPVVGMIGILDDKNHQMTISFKNKGNIIFLVGQSKEDISSSEYLYSYHDIKQSPPQWFDIDLEYKTQVAVQELIKKNYVCSAHSVSKGGLFIALVESAMRFGLGFDIITDTDIRSDAFLFGESQGRILVSITPNKEDNFIDFMLKKEIPFLALGHVTKGEMRIDDISFGFIDDAKREYENTLEKLICL